MVSIFQALILGIIQGITEWLPVSSSGHLVLMQNLFGLEPPVIFDLVLHIGSLLVVFIVFWKDIKELVLGVIKKDRKYLSYALFLILSTIPIGFVGIIFNSQIKAVFNDPRTVGFSLLFTAMLLFLSRFPKKKNKRLNLKNILVIGFAQALAILPGVSRSGSTISVGLIQGVNREEAARFSFLMFIPAILGATLMEIKDIAALTADIPALVIGTLAAVITGVISLKLLLAIIKKDSFHHFAWYCLALGIVILLII
ncbi:undecaprenyl-diphosphatase [Candidatus Woesearchaeota archaeon]|nr:undecaprenyl-diphosphatase [Candidatus Woesearchaeota archaeon]